MRLTLFWAMATTLPTVMVRIARISKAPSQVEWIFPATLSFAVITTKGNAIRKTRMNEAKPAAFGPAAAHDISRNRKNPQSQKYHPQVAGRGHEHHSRSGKHQQGMKLAGRKPFILNPHHRHKNCETGNNQKYEREAEPQLVQNDHAVEGLACAAPG